MERNLADGNGHVPLAAGAAPRAWIGLLLALVLMPALAWGAEDASGQSLLAAAEPGHRRPAVAAQPIPVQFINGLLAEGLRLEQAGQPAEALILYYQARAHAIPEYHPGLVMSLDYRISAVHMRLYRESSHPAQLNAAIQHWEHERELYAAQKYPEGFRGLVLYDLAGGYLALAGHENLSANLDRAAGALKEARKLLEGEAAGRVQHILASRMQTAPR